MAAAVTTPLIGARPPVPYGRRIELPRRGTTFVRELPGPAGAPTVLLLHGWCASAGLNWYQAFDALGEHFRVVAPDLRGHSRGLRSRSVFRLAECADDCAETIVQLDAGPVIAVGYSMGGPIAQLLWRRHRDLVSGLVLCATSANFFVDRRAQVSAQLGMFAAVAAARAGARIGALGALALGPMPSSGMPMWATSEMRRHDWRMIIEAGHSICTYRADWVREIDVPATSIVTTEDRGVTPDLQIATADAIPGATMHTMPDGHFACANPRFADVLLRACFDVAGRVR
jgi:pimeloyl-ACP methyl ester carboxylesterase